MVRDFPRQERTLPDGSSTTREDLEAGGETSAPVSFPPLSIDINPGEGEPAPNTGSEPLPQNSELPAAGGPPGTALHPVTSGRGSRWFNGLKVSAKVLIWMVVFPFLCILPFIVVLRIAVLAYQENTYAGWESLGIGIISAVLLVCVYIAAFMWTFGIRRSLFMPFLNVCLTAMLCYSGYALFHLATGNAKTAEVRSYYTSLHPFLRVAVKNLTLVDEDLVITDTHRTKAEYVSMGMRPREYSLHFRQPTGFVHAIDIRTNGRSRMSNLLVELYFILMGFETIRHVGTADHLHIALPLAESDTLTASSDTVDSD